MFSFVYRDIDFAHKIGMASSPTDEFYKHIHTFNEILYLVHGNINYTVESETLHLTEGDIVVIPAGKYHFASGDLDNNYERYVLKFPNRLVPDYIAGKFSDNNFFYTGSKKFNISFNLLDSYVESYSNEECYVLSISELTKLIVMLCHTPSQQAVNDNGFIREVIQFIDDNIYSPITMQSLIDHFNYSKSHICTEFNKHLKIPVMQYVRSKKIIAAHQLILGGMKKSEVAEKLGFENYSTFYRCYKKLIDDTSDINIK
jgi:AraC-like DNA-binding protein